MSGDHDKGIVVHVHPPDDESVPKIIKELAVSAVSGGAGGVVIHWLGLSVNGAICAGIVLGIPAFLAIRGFLNNRLLRKEDARLRADLDAVKKAVASLQERQATIGALTISPASSPSEHFIATERGVTVMTQDEPRRLESIGIIRDLKVTQKYRNTSACDCICSVDFLGFESEAVRSPSELLVTSKDGVHHLGRLLAQPVARGSWTTIYTGIIDHVGGLIDVRTMHKDEPRLIGGFCELEIHVPAGEVGKTHEKALSRLDFELTGQTFKRLIVEVAPTPVSPDGKVKIVLPLSSLPRFPEEPVWEHWAKMDKIELWQGVVLSLQHDPDRLTEARSGRGDLRRLNSKNRNDLDERLKLAESHLGNGLPVVQWVEVEGRTLQSTVRLAEFLVWAESIGWEIPPHLQFLLGRQD